jgi:hypothetical protein
VNRSYKIKGLKGNGNQSLSDKIANVSESVASLMADRKGNMDSVKYPDIFTVRQE